MKIEFKYFPKKIEIPSLAADMVSLCDPVFYAVLICVMQSGGEITPKQIAKICNISEARANDAMLWWETAGIYKIIDKSNNENNSYSQKMQLKASDLQAKNEIKNDVSEKPLKPLSVKLSPKEISSLIDSDAQLKGLFDDLQKTLGRPVNTHEAVGFVNIYQSCGLGAPAISLLTEYCKKQGKSSIAYIKKVAEDWAVKGISTYFEVEAEIKRLEDFYTYSNMGKRAFGLDIPKLTQKQERFFERWQELGFDESMLKYVYEVSVDSIKKLSFEYIDTILTRWASKKIFTVEKAKLDDLEFIAKKPKANSSFKNQNVQYNNSKNQDFQNRETNPQGQKDASSQAETVFKRNNFDEEFEQFINNGGMFK